MMNQEQNDLITRIGPDTPCGKLMRNYWQPARSRRSSSPPAHQTRPSARRGFRPVPDEAGRLGLMDRDCRIAARTSRSGGSRTGPPLRVPRLAVRRRGEMPRTPAEPADLPLCQNIRQRACPVVERSGILWAYLGEGEPPAFPEIDCFVAPVAYTFAFKGLMECNWLQALEVGIDPAHASFLHRFFEDEDPPPPMASSSAPPPPARSFR